jgi:hypothetical protein
MQCINLAGSYECKCKSGTMIGAGGECIDIISTIAKVVAGKYTYVTLLPSDGLQKYMLHSNLNWLRNMHRNNKKRNNNNLVLSLFQFTPRFFAAKIKF